MRQNLEEKYRDISTFKVGEVARKAGVNKETLRYYEKRKLITKQELGFTLSEIKELLELRTDENTTCSEVRTEAEEKYKDVVEKIEDLQRIKTTLVELIDSCSGSGPKGDCPILEALEGENKTGRELRN